MIPVKKIRILFVFIVILLIYCFSTLIPFVSVKVSAPHISVQNNDATGIIEISWDDVTDAHSYEVYRSTDKTGGYTLIASTSLTRITDLHATPDREYFYYAVAVDDRGDVSEHSNTEDIFCRLAKPEITLSNHSGSGKVMVSWDAVEGAKEYDIYRSQTADGKYTLIATTAETSAVDTDSILGQRYCYKVYARGTNPAADSGFSAAKSRACILATPDVSLENVASTGKIKVKWQPVEGAVNYKVYRSSTQENGYQLLITTKNTAITNTSISVGDTWFYRVVAVGENIADNSSFSAPQHATCTLPGTRVTLSNVEKTGKVKVSWKKVTGAQSYEIYRSDSKDGEYQLIGTKDGTFFVDKEGKACSVYYYKVKALNVNPLADSMFSQPQAANCRLAAPQLSIHIDNSGKAVVEWDKVDGAEKYQVFRSLTGKNGSFKQFATTEDTKLVNPSAQSGETWYYKVKAVAAEKKFNGTPSDSDCVYTDDDGAFLPSYVLLPSVTMYPDMNDLTKTVTAIYMEPVYTGKFYSDATGGKWITAKYNGNTCYAFINDTMPTYTRTQSSFDYASDKNTDLQNKIVTLAAKYAFEPTFYSHGMSDGIADETGRYGFDCSGLVAYVFNSVVQQENPLYRLSRTLNTICTYDVLYNEGLNGEYRVVEVAREDIQPGDVIFFKVNHNDSRAIDHCGIYLGNNEFVHATSRFNNGVCIMPLDYVFNSEFRHVKRFVPAEIVPAQQMITATAATYLYSEKSTTSEKLCSFRKGETATLMYTNATGNWGYVRCEDGKEGFVTMKNYTITE